jgi:hypothetical protein
MESKRLSPLKSIRKYCLSCAGSCKGVRTCDTTDCYLFPFKMGKSSNRAGIGVGIRDSSGRFCTQNTPLAVLSEMKAADKGKDKGVQNLINLEAPSKQISVIKKGTLKITEDQGMVTITITKKPKGGRL